MKHARIAFLVSLILTVMMLTSAQQQISPPPTKTSQAEETKNGATSADAAIAGEKAMWAAEKKKDKSAFEVFLADDYGEIVDDRGFLDRAAVLATFDHNALEDYSLGGIRVTRVHPDVVLLTYEFHIKEMHGTVQEGSFFASSLWANRSGRWVNVFFQETPKPNSR